MLEVLGDVPPGVWGLLGTVFGAYVVHLGQKRLKDVDDKRETSRDYRSEITELVKRMDELEAEVTFWRQRFYEEQENNALLRVVLIQNGVMPPPLIPRPGAPDVSNDPPAPTAPPASP